MTHRWSDLGEFMDGLSSETEAGRQCRVIAEGLREPVAPSHELLECRGCEKTFHLFEGVVTYSSNPMHCGFWCDACEAKDNEPEEDFLFSDEADVS